MRRRIDLVLSALVMMLGGCKTAHKMMQQDTPTVLYGVPYATYDVQGRVVDANGEGKEKVPVVMKGYRGKQVGDTLLTNAQGRFEAQADGFPTDTLWLVADEKDSTAVVINGIGENAAGMYRGEHKIDATIRMKE